MTNGEVHELLKAAQQFWKKYRDNVPDHNDSAAWDEAFREANAPLEGLPEYASHIMLFFWEELHARDMKRGTT